MPVWRLIFDKIATLQEIETHWSLDDVMRALALLELKADIQTNNSKKGHK